MRKIEYLSPTSIAAYKQDLQSFYLRYLSDNRPSREPQTLPMSIGSAFDAFVKSYLHGSLFGKGNDPRFDLMTIFEAQVESRNRDWALINGKYAFEVYRDSGALADLMLELSQAVGTPRFEFEVRGVVNGQREGVTKSISGVTFLGKPDVSFNNKGGNNVVLDFKVNGWCSRSPVSPMPGYLRIRGHDYSGCHKDCVPVMHKGIYINRDSRLEDFKTDWATQLAIYGWLCGNEVGSDFIVAIDQLACKPNQPFPRIRIAEHRLRVGEAYQWQTFAKAQEIWDVVNSNHIFRGMSLEDSQARCKILDQQSALMTGDDFDRICRGY